MLPDLELLEKSFLEYKPIFHARLFQMTSFYLSQNPNQLQHYGPNQFTFGTYGLGLHIWNGLPNEIKSAENLDTFECMINKWDASNCQCNA